MSTVLTASKQMIKQSNSFFLVRLIKPTGFRPDESRGSAHLHALIWKHHNPGGVLPDRALPMDILTWDILDDIKFLDIIHE